MLYNIVEKDTSYTQSFLGVASVLVAAPVIIAGIGIFKAVWPLVPILLAASIVSSNNNNGSSNQKTN